MGLGPAAGAICGIENLLEPVKVNIGKQRRNDALNAKDNFDFFHVIKHNRGAKKC
jgi:hypothetical protein